MPEHISGDRAQELHNKGEQDASDGVYKPPHNELDDFLTTVGGTSEEMHRHQEENDAYNAGHHNTWEQTHNDGGCFLTTACTQAAGLPDDCHELATLRHFRDTYVRSLPKGDAIVAEYYAVAPRIVPKLSKDELEMVYAVVRQAVALIGRGEFAEAFGCYEGVFNELRHKHLGI